MYADSKHLMPWVHTPAGSVPNPFAGLFHRQAIPRHGLLLAKEAGSVLSLRIARRFGGYLSHLPAPREQSHLQLAIRQVPAALLQIVCFVPPTPDGVLPVWLAIVRRSNPG